LTQAVADINAVSSPDDRTALMCANGKLCCGGVLQAFLNNGADIMVATTADLTALHQALAAAKGRTDLCEALIARESSLMGVKDVGGWTALVHAAASGTIDTMQVLLQHGADIQAVDNDGQTALTRACLRERFNVIDFLLKAGADVNAADCDGFTALMIASQSVLL
jgi:ankyrin repeat protein